MVGGECQPAAAPDDARQCRQGHDGRDFRAYEADELPTFKKLGLKARELTVHDLGRAKAISESESDQAGQELVQHESVGVTRRHYRRKAAVVEPRPSVKKEVAK